MFLYLIYCIWFILSKKYPENKTKIVLRVVLFL